MLDTMTATKIVGGVCGTFLVFLLGKWGGEVLFHTGGGHGGEQMAAYVIEVEDSGSAEPEAEVDFATLLASADPAKGEKVFGKCKACHKVDGTNATGPHLDGVVGRAIDAVDGFNYSGALLQVGDVWSPENLNHFLTDTKAAAPGTAMSFKGLPKAEDRADVIAYLQTLGG
ncbi:c-type cytochrome [Tropicibacter sp. S64]|uniref:c-type cytochrome n=1 Tax=Tropicibacter sp. S64 TaxID=3415122 RepID=UPI003C79E08D